MAKIRYPLKSGFARKDEGNGGNGNGGGTSYVAQAVHFNGTSWLFNAGLTASDSPVLTFSGWVKANVSTATHAINFFDLDTTSNEFGPFIDAPSNLRIAQNWYDSDGASLLGTDGVAGSWINGSWNHVFGTMDTNHAEGGKTIKTFLNGVDVSGPVTDLSPAFSIWLNGVNMALPDNTDDWPNPQLVGDMADWWIAPVHVTDISIFRDPVTGKPKDPAGFPAGAIVLFSGNASTFPTNKGTGGAFTLTGVLTNASTSPSG
jgi:hypothetical protein